MILWHPPCCAFLLPYCNSFNFLTGKSPHTSWQIRAVLTAERDQQDARAAAGCGGAEVERVARGLGLAPALLGALRALKQEVDNGGWGTGPKGAGALAEEVSCLHA